MPKYESNFLEKVILKLDFENVSLAKIDEYSETISSTFDIGNTRQGFEGSINIDVVGGVMEQSKQDLVIKEFSSTTKTEKKLTLSQKWISLEYNNRSYTDSTELISDLKDFILPFLELFEVAIVNRVGLRYINQVSLDDNSEPLQWDTYINKKLLQTLSFAKDTEFNLSRSFTQQFYKSGDMDIVSSSGIWNEDFPNTIAKKDFILDFDCSIAIPRGKEDINLEAEVKSFNALIEKLFESSIEDGLRTLMGVSE